MNGLINQVIVTQVILIVHKIYIVLLVTKYLNQRKGKLRNESSQQFCSLSFANHEKSKKHKENVLLLKETLELDEEEIPPHIEGVDTPVTNDGIDDTNTFRVIDKIDTSVQLEDTFNDTIENEEDQYVDKYTIIIIIFQLLIQFLDHHLEKKTNSFMKRNLTSELIISNSTY